MGLSNNEINPESGLNMLIQKSKYSTLDSHKLKK